MKNTRCAIIGGSEDGKTFLATGISRGLWRHYRARSLAFDPYKGETPWGPQALVFGPTPQEQSRGQSEEACLREFELFRKIITTLKPEHNFAGFWDESGDNGGRDRDNKGLVTACRHNLRHFFMIGHSYADMLPAMRGSLTDVLLSTRSPEDAREWAAVMTDPDVMQATQLRQYEFLHKRKHHPVKILRYSLEQILAGIIL